MIDVKASGDLEVLTQHVLDSAKEAAEATIERANVRANEIAGKARKRSQEREQELVRAGAIGVEQARKQIISQAKLRFKEDLLATKAKVLHSVISGVRDHLEQMRDKDEKAYLNLLLKLAKEALSGQESDHALLYLSDEDAASYGEEIKRVLAGELKGKIEIQPGKISGGVIVELPEEHVQIDASFDELLREAIPKITDIVGKEIFLSEDEHEESKDGN